MTLHFDYQKSLKLLWPSTQSAALVSPEYNFTLPEMGSKGTDRDMLCWKELFVERIKHTVGSWHLWLSLCRGTERGRNSIEAISYHVRGASGHQQTSVSEDPN